MVELPERLRDHRVMKLFERCIESLKQGTISLNSGENGLKAVAEAILIPHVAELGSSVRAWTIYMRAPLQTSLCFDTAAFLMKFTRLSQKVYHNHIASATKIYDGVCSSGPLKH